MVLAVVHGAWRFAVDMFWLLPLDPLFGEAAYGMPFGR